MSRNKTLYVITPSFKGMAAVGLYTDEVSAKNIERICKNTGFDAEMIEIPGISMEEFNQEFKAKIPSGTEYIGTLEGDMPVRKIPTEVARKIINEIKDEYESK